MTFTASSAASHPSSGSGTAATQSNAQSSRVFTTRSLREAELGVLKKTRPPQNRTGSLVRQIVGRGEKGRKEREKQYNSPEWDDDACIDVENNEKQNGGRKPIPYTLKPEPKTPPLENRRRHLFHERVLDAEGDLVRRELLLGSEVRVILPRSLHRPGRHLRHRVEVPVLV